MSLWRFTTFVAVLPIAHSPVFKIFDLTQISVGFRDERRPLVDLADVRYGSKADIEARPFDVRFTSKSGHR